jgi:uncharacterized protein (DUF983 family)
MRRFAVGLWDALRLRCPRCRRGRMFRGVITMNDPCPVCGLVFERETGYFLGAMYISYGIGCIILTVSYFVAAALFPTWTGIAIAAVALIPYPPFIPIIYRYSRVFWVYFDRYDANDLSAGFVEDRMREEARGGQDGESASQQSR